MKLNLELADIHNPLFLNGTNWGLKLQPKMGKGELELVYDRAEKELLVKDMRSGKIAIIPTTNVASMTPTKASLQQKPETITSKVKKKFTAQASSPMDHVFSGEGKGKVRD